MNKKTAHIPDRGDIVWIDLAPIKGHEQGGYRPALVMSKKVFNYPRSLMIICSITSQEKKHPFNVVIKSKNINGYILSDQIRTIDWPNRKMRFIEKINDETYQEVVSRISLLIEG